VETRLLNDAATEDKEADGKQAANARGHAGILRRRRHKVEASRASFAECPGLPVMEQNRGQRTSRMTRFFFRRNGRRFESESASCARFAFLHALLARAKGNRNSRFHHRGTLKSYHGLPNATKKPSGNRLGFGSSRNSDVPAAREDIANVVSGRCRVEMKKLPNVTIAGRKNCPFNPYSGLIAV